MKVLSSLVTSTRCSPQVVRRRSASRAVATLLCCTSLTAWSCRHEGPLQVSPVEIKLAARVAAGVADTRQPIEGLDLGDPGATSFLTSGWNPPRKILGADGQQQTIVRTEGSVSILDVPLTEKTPLTVSLRLSPVPLTDAPIQYVTVLWNDSIVERRRVEGPEQVLDFAIAAERQRYGLNTLAILPHYWTDEVKVGFSETDLRPGLVLGGVRITPVPPGKQTATPFTASGDELIQTAGSTVSFYEFVPAAGKLAGALSFRGEAGSMDPNARVHVSLQQDGKPPRSLLDWAVSELQGPAPKSFEVDLAEFAGQPGALTLVTPRAIEPSAEGTEGPRFVWHAPALRGFVPAPIEVQAPPLAKKPNIVVVLFDTLRADFTGPSAGPSAQTPNMNRLAARGVSFVNATANAASTRPSVATLLTGLLPPVHKVTITDAGLAENFPYLPAILKDAGYVTIGASDNPHISNHWGFARGFDRFTELFDKPEHEERRRGSAESLARDTWELAVEPALREQKDTPFFVYVHEIDPHFPYDPPPGYSHIEDFGYRGALSADPLAKPEEVSSAKPDELAFMNFVQTTRVVGLLNNHRLAVQPADIRYLRSRYAAEVAYMDAYLGWILDRLAESKQDENTLVVFLSDHGEQFFEHGRWTHGPSLFQEDVKVPLVMSLPGYLPEGSRPTIQAQLVDVVPTLLQILGITPPGIMQGHSLLPAAMNETPVVARHAGFAYSDPRFFFDSDSPQKTLLTTKAQQSVRVDDWKLLQRTRDLQDGTLRHVYDLYDLATDPAETVNLWASRPVLGNTLRQALALQTVANDRTDIDAPTPEMDQVMRGRLQSLGYLE